MLKYISVYNYICLKIALKWAIIEGEQRKEVRSVDRENREFETIEVFIEKILALKPVEQGMLLGFMCGLRAKVEDDKDRES